MEPRHCEEQSDEAIHSFFALRDGLLRYARNDADILVPAIESRICRRGIAYLAPLAGRWRTNLPQPQLLIPPRRHRIAPRAIGRRAAAVAGDDAGLLDFDVGVDAGHPGTDLVGQ